MLRNRRWTLLTLIIGGLVAVLLGPMLLSSGQTEDSYSLVYSTSSDHSSPNALDGAEVSGAVYVFTTPDEGVEVVTFYLDGQLVWVEDNPPFDFAGGNRTTANPWNTTRVADGAHTIIAELLLTDGSLTTIEASFIVNNTGGDEPADEPITTADSVASVSYALVYSESADHAAPVVLEGTTVSGSIYVFTTPDDGVDDVTFYLDGVRVWTEDNPPFDFAGGDTQHGNPWNTAKVADGPHTISAELLLIDGVTTIISASFVVDNGSAIEPTPTPTEEPIEPTPTPTPTDEPVEPTPTATEDPAEPTPTPGDPTPTPTATPDSTEPEAYDLVYSTTSNRENPVTLDGAEVSGSIYVFTTPDTDVEQVTFFLNGMEIWTENSAPFDLAGGSESSANPWDTTQVADGSYAIAADIRLTDGSTVNVSASFTVQNTATEDPPSSPPIGSGGQTEIATGAMLGSGFDPHGFYIRESGGGWQPTYAGTALEGRLMNFRSANALFDDENRTDDNPDANTNAFISNFDAYKAHGILAMTVSLQGGNPGYEGALVSAFYPDGSLKADWMERASRVIEAADQRGMVIILTYFYQRQDQVLADEAAVKQAVVNVTDWLIASNYRNVVVEIANEFDLGYLPDHEYQRWQHDIIYNNTMSDGIGELILLAKSRFDGAAFRLPVSASKSGISWNFAVAQVGDVALVHGNGVRDWEGDYDTYSMMRAIYDNYDVPVVMNEDDNGSTPGQTLLDRDQHAMDDAIQAGGSWGLMWKPYNQLYPMKWSLGDPESITTQAGYFHAILDVYQQRLQ